MTDAATITEAARTLSQLGASKGGLARAQALTSERRREIATKAARTRWAKKQNERKPDSSPGGSP